MYIQETLPFPYKILYKPILLFFMSKSHHVYATFLICFIPNYIGFLGEDINNLMASFNLLLWADTCYNFEFIYHQLLSVLPDIYNMN